MEIINGRPSKLTCISCGTYFVPRGLIARPNIRYEIYSVLEYGWSWTCSYRIETGKDEGVWTTSRQCNTFNKIVFDNSKYLEAVKELERQAGFFKLPVQEQVKVVLYGNRDPSNKA